MDTTKATIRRIRSLILVSYLCCLNAFSLDLTPKEDQYLIVGDTLNFTCIAKRTPLSNPQNAAPLKLRKLCPNPKEDCASLPFVSTDRQEVNLVITNVTINDSGTYECSWDKHTDYRHVKIGYSPKRPDVFCYSINWLNMTCVVTLSPSDVSNPLPTDWSFNFSVDHGQFIPCLDLKKHLGICNWYSAFDDYHGDERELFQSLAVYDIVINVRSRAKSANFHYQIITSHIVKPSRVESLRAEFLSSETANISWTLPDQLIPMFIMHYNIEIKSKWNNTAQKREITNKGRYTSVVLSDLVPFTNYTISVSCKTVDSLDERYRSEPAILTITTAAAVPGMVPGSVTGGYYVPKNPVPESSDVLIFLYLQSIPPWLQHGNNLFYLIKQANPTGIYGNVKDISYRIMPPSNTAQLLLPRINHDPITFEITACNDNGCAKKNSLFTIPSPAIIINQDYPFARDITIESYKPRIYLLSWTVTGHQKTDVVGYTCLWCRGNIDNRTCKSNTTWKKLQNPKITSLQIEVDASQNDHMSWMFGVAVITKDGQSSGMAFADCIFFDHGERNDPNKPTFNLLPDDTDNARISVSLTFTYCDSYFLRSRPKVYTVFYKEVSEKYNNKSCIQDADIKEVIATMDIREIILDDLHSGSTYSVCMTIKTRHGESEVSGAQYISLQTASKKDTTLDSRIVAGVVAVCFVVLAAICICCRYLYTKWNSIDDTIEDIEINLHKDKHIKVLYFKESQDIPNDEDSGIHGLQSQLIDTSAESARSNPEEKSTSFSRLLSNDVNPAYLLDSKEDKEINHYVKTTLAAGNAASVNIVCDEESAPELNFTPCLLQRQPFHPLLDLSVVSSSESINSDISKPETQYSSAYGVHSDNSVEPFSSDSDPSNESSSEKEIHLHLVPSSNIERCSNPYLSHDCVPTT